ncbi:MAG TPA: MFS transporter, partial [Caulobacteraceae bacterium]
ALFRPGTPHWVIYAVLLTGGFFRSLQFTSLNGIAFADVDHAQMSRASTMSTMGQQLSQSIGIGLSATLLHMIMVGSHAPKLTADVIAPVFLAIGGVALIPIAFFLPLPADAGAELHGPPPIRAR